MEKMILVCRLREREDLYLQADVIHSIWSQREMFFLQMDVKSQQGEMHSERLDARRC